MRTKKNMFEALGRIMELGGFSAEQEADFASIRDGIEERDKLLAGAYDPWDEEADEVELVKTVGEIPNPDKELQAKYDDLVARYKANFFAGGVREGEDSAVDVSEGMSGENVGDIRVSDLFVPLDK